MICLEAFPRKIRDTPCWRCWHSHHGGPAPTCGEWMSEWTLAGASWWRCDCPEWVQPPKGNRCWCGKVQRAPWPLWLGDVRACSADCAYRLLGETA